MVVGAGRGPLVRASLTAGEESGRKVRVYAVEKNPNAVVTWVLFLCDAYKVDENYLEWISLVPYTFKFEYLHCL